MMSFLYRPFLAFFLISQIASASVTSETLVYLKGDGRDYLLQRAMRTDQANYDFYVEKHINQHDLLYVDPSHYTWDGSGNSLNRLHFDSGNFVVMYPNRFEEEVSLDEDGIFTFKSWDGRKLDNGHFGMWNSPEHFSRFSYAWIYPEEFEIIDYQANKSGQWVHRQNMLSFNAQNVNDLVFIIRYRKKNVAQPDRNTLPTDDKPPLAEPNACIEKCTQIVTDADADGVNDEQDQCLETPADAKVNGQGCELDSDNDGVVDSKDQCPETPAGAKVNGEGCGLDSDNDGVVDSKDQCPETPAGAKVNGEGCGLDSDNDGVVDSKDQCPETPADAKVNGQGCELDSDNDGVVDSKDQCPETPADAKVNGQGCELDSDNDGVVDSKDQCPETPADAKVNGEGCELDSDNDGVVDSKDQCPETPADAKVNGQGCELDSDNDGVVDSKDQCPETPADAKVNGQGCELDSDNDGVVDSRDQCPETPAGAKINGQGCELDSDNDGVVDSKDQCPETPADAKVNGQGCELDSDNDGVVDSKDQCPETPAGAKVNGQGCQPDQDADGVVDAVDFCPATQPDAKVDATGCEIDAVIILKGVNFASSSADLTEEAKTILNGVAAQLSQIQQGNFEIAGYTDNSGRASVNQQLSQSRAESVRAYLIEQGVAADRLTAKGYGETNPIADNATSEGRAQNRRVELNRL